MVSCWAAFPGVTKFEKPYLGQVHKLGMQNEVYTDYAKTKKMLSTSVEKSSYSNNNAVKNDRENRKRHQNCSSNHLRMGLLSLLVSHTPNGTVMSCLLAARAGPALGSVFLPVWHREDRCPWAPSAAEASAPYGHQGSLGLAQLPPPTPIQNIPQCPELEASTCFWLWT